MATSPLKTVLDRDFARVGAKNAIEITCPLLRELVNHATNVFQRCQAAQEVPIGQDEDIGPLCLYRMVMEFYLREIKPSMDKLRNVEFTLNIVEEGDFPG